MSKRTILECKRVTFYSYKDEDAFFEWIKKIDIIDNFWGEGDTLYLDTACIDLGDEHLRDLIALFYRYNIRMSQLKRFMNKSNEEWFCDSKAFWYKKVFGTISSKEK